MSAIDFVVRDSAGNIQNGSFGGGLSNTVAVGVDQQISLNLTRAQIQGFERQGQALQITLLSGEVIMIEGFFTPDGIPENQLFISANGQLDEVQLMAGSQGAYYPNYVAFDNFGKWSPEDDLYFVRGSDVQVAEAYVAPEDDQAGMLFTPLLGGLGGLGGLGAAGLGAGLLGGGLLLGGGGIGGGGGNGGGGGGNGGNGGGGVPPLQVVITNGTGPANVVNAVDYSDGVELGGTGTAGAQVSVVLAGATQTTTVGTNGTWNVVFPPGSVPDGTYTSTAAVTLTSGGQTATATGTVIFDTEAAVSIATAAVEVDGVVNGGEGSDGFVLSGATQPGSTVVVTVSGVPYAATVTGGTWSVTIPTVVPGEYGLPVSAVATDSYGNTATSSGVVQIDSYVNSLTLNQPVEGDDRVNGAEAADGIAFSGAVEAGSTVIVTYQGAPGIPALTLPATVTGTSWAVNFTSAQIPRGEYMGSVTVRATDAAGNVKTLSDTFQVDTYVNNLTENQPVEGDDRVNAAEASDGIPLRGSVEAGSTVMVTFQGPAGSAAVTLPATVSGSSWNVNFPAGQVPQGEYTAHISITATDSFGNVKTISDTFQVDTFVNNLTHPGAVEGNDIVNAAEASDGVTLTGTVEAGSHVVVTMSGAPGMPTVSYAATVVGNTWSVTYPAGSIPGGEYTANISIAATDSFGNTKTISDTFVVDTVAPDAPFITAIDDGRTGLRSIAVADEDTSLQVFRIDGTGQVSEIAFTAVQDLAHNEVDLDFSSVVPNGSTFVIGSTDAAGNESATLFVYDKGAPGSNVVDVSSSALDRFNISAIDLGFAEDATLTLSAADLRDLSNNTNALTIHGGADDTVTITGAVDTGQHSIIEGQTYDIYSLGADGTVIINEDIHVIL